MQFLIMLALLLLMEVTRPVPAPPAKPGLGDYSAPTAEQDRVIPAFWGHPYLAGPNLVWYGDLRLKKIKKKIKGLFVSKSQVIGYKTMIGMHLVFAHSRGLAKLLEVWVGGTSSVTGADLAWKGELAEGVSSINKPDIWGGEESGGGISGEFSWLNGGATQGQDAYLKRVLGGTVPAWRGICSFVWRGGYYGTQRTLNNIAVKSRRNPNSLGTSWSDIKGEANAAEILYELLTDQVFGMGLTANEIEVESFIACAKTLHEEDFGLSLIWDNTKSLEEIMKEIDRHVDSLTFVNPATGKRKMRLIRNDVDRASIPHVNSSNARLIKAVRPTPDELVNEMIVTYSADELQGKTVPVRVQDIAAFANQGGQRVSSTSAYPGITREVLAKRVCTRDFRALSYPLLRVTLELDRSFFALQPVDRVLFDWELPSGAIQGMQLIVMERSIGTLNDGKITVTAVQDIFGLGETLYSEGSGGSAWVPPDHTPKAPVRYRMEFTPYWLLKIDPSTPAPLAAVPMVMAEAPSASALGMSIHYSDPSTGGNVLEGDAGQPFTPTAALAYDYLETAGDDNSGSLILEVLTGVEGVPFAALSDVRYLGDGLAIVGSEIMAFTSAYERPDGLWCVTGVKRGLLDTAISRHLAGDICWFIGEGLARTDTQIYPFAAGNYSAKLCTQTMQGVLSVSSAPSLSIYSNGADNNARPLYAYPPRRLTVAGVYHSAVVSGMVDVSWVHSNKEAENWVYLHSDTPPPKPSDTSYVVSVCREDGARISQAEALGTSLTVSTGGLKAGYVQVETKNSAGLSAPARVWFSAPDAEALAAPQQFMVESSPSLFTRMSDG